MGYLCGACGGQAGGQASGAGQATLHHWYGGIEGSSSSLVLGNEIIDGRRKSCRGHEEVKCKGQREN